MSWDYLTIIPQSTCKISLNLVVQDNNNDASCFSKPSNLVGAQRYCIDPANWFATIRIEVWGKILAETGFGVNPINKSSLTNAVHFN